MPLFYRTSPQAIVVRILLDSSPTLVQIFGGLGQKPHNAVEPEGDPGPDDFQIGDPPEGSGSDHSGVCCPVPPKAPCIRGVPVAGNQVPTVVAGLDEKLAALTRAPGQGVARIQALGGILQAGPYNLKANVATSVVRFFLRHVAINSIPQMLAGFIGKQENLSTRFPVGLPGALTRELVSVYLGSARDTCKNLR